MLNLPLNHFHIVRVITKDLEEGQAVKVCQDRFKIDSFKEQILSLTTLDKNCVLHIQTTECLKYKSTRCSSKGRLHKNIISAIPPEVIGRFHLFLIAKDVRQDTSSNKWVV